MNHQNRHIFWGSQAPLSSLAGAGLIIMASSRLAFAIICTGALIWVYGFTSLIYFSSQKLMPRRGKSVILLFLSSFVCGIYILCISFVNPLTIMGTCFFLFLVPPSGIGSGIFKRLEGLTTGEVFSRSLLEALVLGGIIIAMSLIREPLGLGSISFPGGVQGIVEISGEYEGFFPVRIFAVSGGGLLILGYGVSLFRYFRGFHTNIGTEENQ
jgi:hypothetical protein